MAYARFDAWRNTSISIGSFAPSMSLIINAGVDASDKIQMDSWQMQSIITSVKADARAQW